MSDSDERDYGRGYNSDKRSSSSSSSNRNAYGYGGGGYESSDSNKEDKYNSGYQDGGSWDKDDDDGGGRGGYEFTYSDQGHLNSPGSDRGVFAGCRRSKSISSNSSKRSLGAGGGFEVSYHKKEESSDWSPKRCRKSRDSSSRSSSQDSDRYRFRFGDNDSDEGRKKRKRAAAAAYLEEESGRTGHNDLPCCCVVL